MSQEPWAQAEHHVRFDLGEVGATRVNAPSGALVIVDVLWFTTAVTVAVERGVVVHPAACRDPRAARLARDVGAVLAVGRSEVTDEHPWSLSPAALRSAPAPGNLVLPSPNGSAIAATAHGVVVAACLRNASAVAAWLSERYGSGTEPVTVIAAGERWPDGSLRPALEDLLGAGAVIAALARVTSRPSHRRRQARGRYTKRHSRSRTRSAAAPPVSSWQRPVSAKTSKSRLRLMQAARCQYSSTAPSLTARPAPRNRLLD